MVTGAMRRGIPGNRRNPARNFPPDRTGARISPAFPFNRKPRWPFATKGKRTPDHLGRFPPRRHANEPTCRGWRADLMPPRIGTVHAVRFIAACVRAWGRAFRLGKLRRGSIAVFRAFLRLGRGEPSNERGERCGYGCMGEETAIPRWTRPQADNRAMPCGAGHGFPIQLECSGSPRRRRAVRPFRRRRMFGMAARAANAVTASAHLRPDLLAQVIDRNRLSVALEAPISPPVAGWSILERGSNLVD